MLELLRGGIMTNISIPNVTITPKVYGGVLKGYDIAPNDGYVIHDKEAGGTDLDGNRIVRFSVGSCSCGKNYEFNTTEITVYDINGSEVVVTAYGSREFFAFPKSLVYDPDNNIVDGV
jgi:hypothetical protein